MTHSTVPHRAEVRQVLEARCERVAAAWRSALAPTSYVPLSASEQRQALTLLTRRIVDVLLGKPFLAAQAQSVGAELVRLGYTRPSALARTIEVLGRDLLSGLAAPERAELDAHL